MIFLISCPVESYTILFLDLHSRNPSKHHICSLLGFIITYGHRLFNMAKTFSGQDDHPVAYTAHLPWRIACIIHLFVTLILFRI